MSSMPTGRNPQIAFWQQDKPYRNIQKYLAEVSQSATQKSIPSKVPITRQSGRNTGNQTTGGDTQRKAQVRGSASSDQYGLQPENTDQRSGPRHLIVNEQQCLSTQGV